MNDITIIGISGQAGSGKDWISQNVLTPIGYHQWSFAWHFKVWLVGQGKITWEDAFITKPPHVRKFLQEEGTERGRMIFGEDIWANTMYAWFRTIEYHHSTDKFVVPDIRFPNEVEAIQKLGGKVFVLNSPHRVANNGMTDDARNHPSETSLIGYEGFDGVIDNDPEHSFSVVGQVYNLIGFEDF